VAEAARLFRLRGPRVVASALGLRLAPLPRLPRLGLMPEDVRDIGLGGVQLFEALHRISKRLTWESEAERVDCVVTAWVACTENERGHSTQTMRWELLTARGELTTRKQREVPVTREQLGALTVRPDPGAALDLAAELGAAGALAVRGLLPSERFLALPLRLSALLKRNPETVWTFDQLREQLRGRAQATSLALGCFELLGAIQMDRGANPPTYKARPEWAQGGKTDG